MQRIEEFLREPEVPDWASSLKSGDATSTDAVGFEDATFQWDVAPRSEPSRFVLGPLDMMFPKGQLSLISGPTGSGKSALLNALLGGKRERYFRRRISAELVDRNDLHVGEGVAQQAGASGGLLRAESMSVFIRCIRGRGH